MLGRVKIEINMKLKFKTLYDPKQKVFVHATHAFGEPLIFTATTPQLLGVKTDKIEFAASFGYLDILDGYELIDIEVNGGFEIE